MDAVDLLGCNSLYYNEHSGDDLPKDTISPLFNHEDGGRNVLQNLGTYLPTKLHGITCQTTVILNKM